MVGHEAGPEAACGKAVKGQGKAVEGQGKGGGRSRKRRWKVKERQWKVKDSQKGGGTTELKRQAQGRIYSLREKEKKK